MLTQNHSPLESATLTVNGILNTISLPLSVAGLIAQLGYTGKRIALERNGEIVPKSEYQKVILAAGDRLEIIAAVGGG